MCGRNADGMESNHVGISVQTFIQFILHLMPKQFGTETSILVILNDIFERFPHTHTTHPHSLRIFYKKMCI